MTKQMLATAREGRIYMPQDGEDMALWLLKQPSIEVEEVDSEGLPSLFPKLTGPKPSLGMDDPLIN